MCRNKLEPKIDHVLGEMLWERDFLRRVADEYNDAVRKAPTAAVDQIAITAKIQDLRKKRERVLETFFDNRIDKQERDVILDSIQRETTGYERLLLQQPDGPQRAQTLDFDRILELVEPLADWEYLHREDRRAILALVQPNISVYQYTIKHLTLDLVSRTGGGYTDSHLETPAAPPRHGRGPAPESSCRCRPCLRAR